jgi:hypothetical protein
MNNFRELVLFMLNQMDDDFKYKHTLTIKRELQKYPCLVLMKEDLIGYLENEYADNTDDDFKKNAIAYINNLDDEDMQNVANEFSNDVVMDSFWLFVKNQLDLIKNENRN